MTERCATCGGDYPAPVSLHHSEGECIAVIAAALTPAQWDALTVLMLDNDEVYAWKRRSQTAVPGDREGRGVTRVNAVAASALARKRLAKGVLIPHASNFSSPWRYKITDLGRAVWAQARRT